MDDVQTDQVPPGQQLLRPGRWPPVGEKPPPEEAGEWTLALKGLFREPRCYTLAELARQPSAEAVIDIHCVTRWTRLAVPFRGIPLSQFLTAEHIHPEVAYVSFVARSDRNHSSSVSLEVARSALLVLEAEGAPLTREHGGPLRVVVPGKYFYKSVKWLKRIELLREDRLGYWEAESGYHNGADPWREERYVAPSISKQLAARLLALRDFSGQDLMGIDAAGRDLEGLRATAALLRNADFRKAKLGNADFTGSNLANARFQGANLRGALFKNTDLEGANLAAADLRGANLEGASLFGAVFYEPATNSAPEQQAVLDQSTILSLDQITLLADRQEQYLRKIIANP